MFRTVRQFLDQLQLLPQSLSQPIGNPTQLDRLPDVSRVELEFPVVSGSLPQNRIATRRRLGIALMICLLVAVAANFNFWYTVEYMLGMLSAVALAAFSAVAIGAPRHWLTWLYYLLVLPPLMLLLAITRQPQLILFVGCCCALFLADRFACHLFHLQTTSLMDRKRATHLRALWRSRWFWSTAKGFELYTLVAIALIALPWWIATKMSEPPSGQPFANFPTLALGLLTLPLLAVVVEFLAAFFYSRPRIRFRDMWAAFRPAFVQWYTYNPQDLRVAGAYQTPAGSCRKRRSMMFWLLLLFTTSFAQFFNHALDNSNFAFRRRGEPHRGIWEKSGDLDPAEWHLFEEAEPIFRGQSPSQSAAVIPILLAQGPTPKLEPYQERTLQRMPPTERAEYLKQLRERQPKPKNEPSASKGQADPLKVSPYAKDWGDPGSFEKKEDRIATRLMLLFVLQVLTPVEWSLYPIFAVLFPLLYVGGYCFATTARVAGYFRPSTEIDPRDLLSSDRWEALVERVQKSGDQHEQTSLLLGVNATDNTPVLVPLKVFEEHAHLLGDSGSGKTSLGISLILSQMVRFPETSVVVIDLKGDDLALFSGTRIDSQKAGKAFRWFTNELGRSTYAFNPLAQEYFTGLSLYQKTDIITTALGLQYGTDYGRGYFSDANAELLFNALKAKPDICSFRELERVLGDRYALRGVSSQVLKDGSHIRTIVSRLAATEALNVTPQTGTTPTVLQDQIEFRDIFRKSQVAYLHLPSSLGTTTSAEIARVALYSLLGSARTVPDAERKQVFVFIDEFQRIVSGNLELILQTARSMKVGLILANQSMYDLKRAGIDLMPAVRANTRYKQIFAASNVEDQQELIALSGQTLVHQRSWRESLSGLHGGQASIGYTESVLPRLGINDILLATDHPLQSIVQIRRGDGYAQYGGFPFVMRSTHHISADEFRARKNASWPEPTPATLVPTIASALPPEEPPKQRRKSIVESKAPLEGEGVSKPHPLEDLWQSQAAKRKKDPPKT